MEVEAPKMLTDLLPENLRAYAAYILGGAVSLAILAYLIVALVRPEKF